MRELLAYAAGRMMELEVEERTGAPELTPQALIAAFTRHMDEWCARERGEENAEGLWARSAHVQGVLEAATPKEAVSAVDMSGAFPERAQRVAGYPNDGYAACKTMKSHSRVQTPLGAQAEVFS